MKGRNQRVNKRITTVLCMLLLFSAASFRSWAAPAPPTVAAESAILVDAVTGKVLFEKNARVRRPPASTTKIMTAIIALENGNPNATVCASKHACETEFGSLHLKPGEKLAFEDLMYALLLRSANDAAVCVAEHIAETEPKFITMMNEKAKEIGAKDTHFVNPHGLYHPKHYSTAYDFALMARYAAKIPEFNEIVRTKVKRINRSMNKEDVCLKNTARFLWRFNGADGIKTGYTKEAGHCFVGSATRGGWRLIAVVLNSKDSGADAAALLEYGFKYYKQVRFATANTVVTTVAVKHGVADKIDLIAKDDLALLLTKSARAESRIVIDAKKVSAPFDKDEKLGTLTGFLNGNKVGTINLIAAKTVDRTLSATIWILVRSVFTVTALFLVGYVAYGTAIAKAARRRRRGI